MIPNRKMVLAGGNGFLGRHLSAYFCALGWDVVVFTRQPKRQAPCRKNVVEAVWDGRTVGDWYAHLEGADVLVNLTGRNVNCRYTPENKREILRSRIDSVRVLGEALRRADRPPPLWVQASSLAIYGDSGDRVCTEESPAGQGFSVEVCRRWEQAFADSLLPGIRGVVLRTGFVLALGEGALVPLENLTRCFLGGTIGDGRQWISWLHVNDTVRAVHLLVVDEDLEGTFNLTAPQPVTNREFMRQLRGVLKRPWTPPTPSWAVRLGAKAMRSEPELALSGRRCLPARLQEAGFIFNYPALNPALSALYGH